MTCCEMPSKPGRSVAATVYCAHRSTAAMAASSVIGTQWLGLLPSNTSECLAPPVPTRLATCRPIAHRYAVRRGNYPPRLCIVEPHYDVGMRLGRRDGAAEIICDTCSDPRTS